MKRAPVLLGVSLIGLACLSGALFFYTDKPATRPNILLILADDLGVNDIGSWGDGSAPTPTLDQLSRQSIRFRRHYTDSTCSVSRAALLTGRSPVSIGFEPAGLGLSPDLATLPKSLKEQGYRTHHVGKWHVGEAIEAAQIRPDRQGFDDWFGMLNHFVLQGPDASGQLIRREPTYINPWLQEGDAAPKQYVGHLDDFLADRAIKLIKQADKRPWFINLWFLAPHTPIQPGEAFKRQFPDTPEGHYLALLKQLDSNVGRVLDALKESDQWDNTIVVFASDNGSPNIGRDNNWPLLGVKDTYTEGGVRTPLLIRWPGHKADIDIQSITQITDLYPTLLRMIRGELPEGLDGLDLTELMERGTALVERPLYWAADVKARGMTYAAHIPGQGSFYRDIYARFSTPAMTAALGANPESGPWQTDFSKAQASRIILDWEKQHRPIPLRWEPATGVVSGRDYQRAPVFGSYSIGLPLEPAITEVREQTLLEQVGVWKISLDQERRILVLHGSQRFLGPVLDLHAGCNSLVASFNIKAGSTFPFHAKASSIFSLYLNGKQVLSSEQLLSRPEDLSVLANPTHIGANADGSAAFQGRVGRPLIVGKYLLPQQDGYSLLTMDESLCVSAEL